MQNFHIYKVFDKCYKLPNESIKSEIKQFKKDPKTYLKGADIVQFDSYD